MSYKSVETDIFAWATGVCISSSAAGALSSDAGLDSLATVEGDTTTGAVLDPVVDFSFGASEETGSVDIEDGCAEVSGTESIWLCRC